jgi:hypothetical protein
MMEWRPFGAALALWHDDARIAVVSPVGRRWSWCLLGPHRTRTGTTWRLDLALSEAETAARKVLDSQAN